MDFDEQIPERASLKYRGEEVAEAWFESEGKHPILMLRVPRHRIEAADADQFLTIEKLLKAAAISNEEVESWRFEPGSNRGIESASELHQPLPFLPPEATHLTITVRLKPPVEETAGDEACQQKFPLEQWQALEAAWKGILGLEASIESSRLSMESLRSEMDAAFKRSLTVEDKLNALQADVAQWNKTKSRIHHALPKAREFIHRATWALAVPERKRLEEIVKNHIEPRIWFAQVDQVREQIEHLQKDRQVLLAQGNTVCQECRGIMSELQRALGSLQRNAADNARRKRSASREKGKHF